MSGLSEDAPTSGVAWVDLDADGDPDALLSRDDRVEFLRNDGCFDFNEHPLDLGGLTGSRLSGAMAADLDQDGLLDLYFGAAGASEQSWLLQADGRWDRFVDRTTSHGVANPGAYARGGASIGDIDGDGWYDLAIGGHQIGGQVEVLGRPHSRMFRFAAGPVGWSDGAFGPVPIADFGAGPSCDPGAESTGLETRLFDADGDGDLDLLWATHNDMLGTLASDACATGANRYGPRLFVNDGTGGFSEQPEGPGSLTRIGRMDWSQPLGHYVLGGEGEAPGAEGITLFDADNDGDRDVLLIAPTDPDWHVSSGQTVEGSPGRLATYLRNDGGVWTEASEEVGLDTLDWTLGEWAEHFTHAPPDTSPILDEVCENGPQTPLCAKLDVASRQPYPSQALPIDADNDGWTDLLFVVRHCDHDGAPEDDAIRSVLLHNRSGQFVPLVTEVSGVVGCGLAAFPVDMDGDGWTDLHLAARENLQSPDTLDDRVFWNRGAQRHPDHHHVDVVLEGRPEPELLGARIVALDDSGATLATGWYERDRWRGSSDPRVHLGLGRATSATLEVHLRDGTTHRVNAKIDGVNHLAP